jgi:hypothetical protein
MCHYLTCRSIGAAALALATPGEFHVAAAQWLATACNRPWNPSAAHMVDSNMGHIGPRWIRPEAAVT